MTRFLIQRIWLVYEKQGNSQIFSLMNQLLRKKIVHCLLQLLHLHHLKDQKVGCIE